MRTDGRTSDELRPISFALDVNPYAEGSVEVSFGKTKLLCTATLETDVPRWMDGTGRGWITAEYGMLPRSTHTRSRREAASGKQGGRTMEIQRLIGRALRQAVDLESLGEVTIRLDCDVIVADGGTRTAAISGAWVALRRAIEKGVAAGQIESPPVVQHVAAISLGKVEGNILLDLCYEEDSAAEFDLNLVMNERGEIVEVQGTAEHGRLTTSEFQTLLTQGESAIARIIELQKGAVAG